MKAAELKKRIVHEVKQSPGKAALLAIGALVAGVVWIPQIASAFGSGPANAPVAELAGEYAALAAVDVAGQPPDTLSDRDAAAIRLEFIRISTEAKDLRRFADPVFPATLHDPFAVAAPEPVVEPAAAEVAVPEAADPRAAEEAKAAAMALTAVFVFGAERSAVVSGRVVAVGDEIDGFRLERIEQRLVVLRGEHDRYVVAMDQEQP